MKSFFCRALIITTLLIPAFAMSSIKYTVKVNGFPNEEVLKDIETNVLLYTMKNSPPSTLASLKTRITKDLTTIEKILRSHAYLDGKVSYTIKEKTTPLKVCLEIIPGRAYHISEFILQPSEHPLNTIPLQDLGIDQGDLATTDKILNAQKKLITIIQNSGYPFANIEDRHIIANPANNTMQVKLIIDKGPRAIFGETHIEGLQKVKPEVIKRHILWEKGEQYSIKKIAATKKALENLGLFSLVTIFPAKEVEGQSLDTQINVIERQHRTITIGADYDTQLGAGGSFQWSHRNFRQQGEKVLFSLNANQAKQQGTLSYRIPYFKHHQQSFVWSLSAQSEDSEGYKAHTTSINAIIERRFSAITTASWGGVLHQIHTAKTDDRQSYTLLGIPLSLHFNYTDRNLDPYRGNFFELKATPYQDLENADINFLINKFTASQYLSLWKTRLTLATSISMGSVLGSSRSNIPAPYRFYGGSANILRGYKYHTVSPLDANNKPIGGRSLALFNIEVRLRTTPKMGLTFFWDIGNIFADDLPRFDQKMLQSCGIGFNYLTPVGPFRLECAFPLDRRPDIDKHFQIYLALGHAF
ncbi:MAG: autotransporter assembly complex protein TamA [Chlamydiota bacterium]